ncbi:Tn3 family transposase [Mesorhizobium sp. M0166]|uniref:Tn3 family transposase n=1 Tax=Mesorhizobium sp. M0166 TaxID=2956902 RepID=UPI003337CF0C
MSFAGIEIRDRSTEGQHYRIAGLNLLTAIIIFWNTLKLGDAVENRNQAGLPSRGRRALRPSTNFSAV